MLAFAPSTVNRIKALLNFARTTATALVIKASHVFDSMNGNPAYPHPPVTMQTFKAAIDQLTALNAVVLDGSKKILAEQKHQVQLVVGMMRDLAHYVESACKGDLPTFLSSGFDPAPTTRNQTPPVSEAIRKIVPGPNSGQVVVTLCFNPDAYSYLLRFRPAANDSVNDDDWGIQPATNTRPALLIKGLTPGTTYTFQVRIMNKQGYGDWSNPVTYICT